VQYLKMLRLSIFKYYTPAYSAAEYAALSDDTARARNSRKATSFLFFNISPQLREAVTVLIPAKKVREALEAVQDQLRRSSCNGPSAANYGKDCFHSLRRL
jgi:hypothetical protein